MKHIGHGRMIHQNAKELAIFRALIAQEAKKHFEKPLEGAVILKMEFGLIKPKTVKRDYPTVPSDLDKYVRSVNDSLTNVVYLDDAQVIEITAKKYYAPNYLVKIEVYEPGFDAL